MPHEMSLTLTDEEYTELAAAGTKSGKPVESIEHDLLTHQLRLTSSSNHSRTTREFMERQRREGKLLNVPTRETLSPHDVAAREERARLLSSGTLASDMVIEDRGPR